MARDMQNGVQACKVLFSRAYCHACNASFCLFQCRLHEGGAESHFYNLARAWSPTLLAQMHPSKTLFPPPLAPFHIQTNTNFFKDYISFDRCFIKKVNILFNRLLIMLIKLTLDSLSIKMLYLSLMGKP